MSCDFKLSIWDRGWAWNWSAGAGAPKTQFRSPSAAPGGDVPATARQQGTGKIMLGRARSRAQALARLPCRVPRAKNTPSAARPGRSRSHGRPSAGIIGFRRGCVRGLARRTPAVEVALVVLLVVVAARLVVVDKHPRRRVAPQPAPQRRPPATTSCFPEVHVGAVWAVPRACRAGLCRPCGSPGRTNPRPPPGCASVPHSSSRHPRPPRPAGRQRHVHSIADAGPQNQPACRGPSRGAGWRPRHPACPGGTFFRGSVFREQALLTRKGWGVERAPPAVVCYFRALGGTEGRK